MGSLRSSDSRSSKRPVPALLGWSIPLWIVPRNRARGRFFKSTLESHDCNSACPSTVSRRIVRESRGTFELVTTASRMAVQRAWRANSSSMALASLVVGAFSSVSRVARSARAAFSSSIILARRRSRSIISASSNLKASVSVRVASDRNSSL